MTSAGVAPARTHGALRRWKMSDDMYEIEGCSVLVDTGKALLVKSPDDEFWVPTSQICENSEVYEKGTTGSLIVTGWFAKQRGWL